MKRRSLLRAVVTTGVAAAAGAADVRSAAAATDYLIVVVEQAANQIQRFSNGTTDWNTSPEWYWSAPSTDTWKYLADAKRRLTANWDDVLVCCANGTASTGGRAAMVRESDKAVVWTAVVPGNPHSVERIDGHGAIVTASAKQRATGDSYENGGGINLFAPSTHGGLPPTSFADSISTGFPGAHGVLWDDSNECLLAIGDNELRAYRLVTNSSGIITGLSKVATLAFSGTGHDLQPDYASPDILYTVGGDAGNPDHGIWKTRLTFNSAAATWTFASPARLYDWYFTKSFSRLPDGTEFWVDAPSAATWWNDTVGFSGRSDSVRTGAKFYKARFWSHVLS